MPNPNPNHLAVLARPGFVRAVLVKAIAAHIRDHHIGPGDLLFHYDTIRGHQP